MSLKIVSKASTNKYRDNWDKIFGKAGSPVQIEDYQHHPEDHESKLSEESKKMLQEGLDHAIAGRMTKIPGSVFKIKKNKKKVK